MLTDLVTVPWLSLTATVSLVYFLLRRMRGDENKSSLEKDGKKIVAGYCLLVGLTALGLDADSVPMSNPLLLVISLHLGLILLSIVWAENRHLSGKFIFYHLVTAAAALAVASRLSLPQCALLFAVLGSWHILTALFDDIHSRSFKQQNYRFAGRSYPFALAFSTVLLGYSAIYLYRLDYVNAWSGTAALLISVVFLFLTRTKSAIAAALVSVTVWLFLVAWGWPAAGWILLLFWSLLAGIGAGLYQLPATRPYLLYFVQLGRTPLPYPRWAVLSGRSIIWRYGWKGALERPLLGYGYASFWSPRRVAEFSGEMLYPRKRCSAHSLYLDTLLNTGAIGLALLVLLLAIAVSTAVSAPVPTQLYGASLVVFFAVTGVADSRLTIPGYEAFCCYLLLFSVAKGV